MKTQKSRLSISFCSISVAVLLFVILTPTVLAALPVTDPAPADQSWWLWPAGLFGLAVFVGILSVLAGAGGGILFLSVLCAFFPVHIDYLRMIALLLSLASALIATPGFLRRGLTPLQMALPAALLSAAGAVIGSYFGLRLAVPILYLMLGTAFFLYGIFLIFQHKIDPKKVVRQDRLSSVLGFSGVLREEKARQSSEWATHRTASTLFLLFLAGLVTGALGFEAGGINVVFFNAMMGAPLGIAIGTSKFVGSFTTASAGWVYFNHGCFIPLLAIPSILGLLAGSLAAIQMHGLVVRHINLFRIVAIFLLIIGGTKVFMKGIF